MSFRNGIMHAMLLLQVLSTKPTRERTKIGTSLRTDKEVGWEGLHLGAVSGQGHNHCACSACGH